MVQKQNYNKGMLIFGKHSVFSAITNKKRNIYKIMVLQQNFAETKDFLQNIAPNLLPKLCIVAKNQIAEITESDEVHQGYILHCSKLNPVSLQSLILNASNLSTCNVIALDNVTDTRNIGAVVRSAVAFGFNHIIMLKNIYNETSAMVKASSGAMDAINIITVPNLVQALEELKKQDFWVVGLSANTNTTINTMQKFNKTVLVMGAEGEGLKSLTEKKCDFVVKIPIHSNSVDSLNISNAAAIAMYEVSKNNL